MKLTSRPIPPMAEGDMTPMIDMTFQLIAFFMILLNFSEAEQNERIKLPNSELAKPPDVPFENFRTLQLTKEGTVLIAGDEVPIAGVEALLYRERRLFESQKKDLNTVTMLIRGDSSAKTGRVQELIAACQRAGFEQFSLHAKQSEPD